MPKIQRSGPSAVYHTIRNRQRQAEPTTATVPPLNSLDLSSSEDIAVYLPVSAPHVHAITGEAMQRAVRLTKQNRHSILKKKLTLKQRKKP